MPPKKEVLELCVNAIENERMLPVTIRQVVEQAYDAGFDAGRVKGHAMDEAAYGCVQPKVSPAHTASAERVCAAHVVETEFADAMSGAELRACVESGEPIVLAVSYNSHYWLVPWTDRKEILELADQLSNVEEHRRHYQDIEDADRDHLVGFERVGDEGALVLNVVLA